MNIRCERCSTMYELDEKLLAPEGSPVQCTKCQHVFTAVPPRSAGRTLVGVPAAPPPAPPAAPRAPAAAAPRAESQGTAARQGPAIYKPAQSAAPPRAPRAQRDTMGTFEARLRNSARLRWLVPVAVVGVVVLAVAGWLLLSSSVDPVAQRRHAEAMALVAQDDMASLEKASQTLDELTAKRTGLETIEADRALAQLLLATGLQEDVSAQAERLARKIADRDRLGATQPPPEGLAALTAEVEALRGQVEPRQAKARSLSERAYGRLKEISGERAGDLSVMRALAVYYASVGDREQALRFIRVSSGGADRDPWLRLAEGWLDAREEGKEARERGAAKLTALVSAHPEIVRARYLLAKTQASLGRREQAAATLDGLLAANPGHQRGRRLREELVVAPAPAPAAGVPTRPAGAMPPATAAPVVPMAPRLVGPAPTPLAPPTQRPLPVPGVPPPAATPAAPKSAAVPGPAPSAGPTAVPAGGGAPATPTPRPLPAAPSGIAPAPRAAPAVAPAAAPPVVTPPKPAGAAPRRP